jgi:hypothetical protein
MTRELHDFGKEMGIVGGEWCHLIPFSKKASTPRVGGGEKSLRKSFRLDFCRVCPPPPYWLMRLFTFGSG